MVDVTVTLSLDELAAVLDEVATGHNVEDFEPECPTCTAYRKLRDMLNALGAQEVPRG